VAELGAQITTDYVGKKPVLIGVLNSAFVFLADLARAIDLECTIDFIKVGSYDESTTSAGAVKLIQDIKCSITGRDVIIVEDVIETGLTMQFLIEHLSKANPRSIRIAALLHKNITPLDLPIDYVGFNIAPEFVIGYGLDYAQAARNLKDIYKLAE
jgi:hypoxanthine phosphoribosyltransferase